MPVEFTSADPYDDQMTATIDGSTLDGVSTTTLWTLHNRGTEAKRSDGVIRDPWAVTRYLAPPMPFGQSADEAVALAGAVAGVRLARDVALPRGRGAWRLGSAAAVNHLGPLRRNRPSITLLEFG
jgi:hypothetical protein